MTAIPYPSYKRAFASLAAAPLMPVAILFLLDATDRALQFGPVALAGAALLAVLIFVVVEAFTLVFGGLMLRVLWGRVPFSLPLCMLFGGIVALLPMLLLDAASIYSNSGNVNAWSDNHPTVIDGVTTAYGYWEDLVGLFWSCLLGTIGGSTFWWLCRSKRLTEVEPE
jgi:hypothetical protein